MQILNAEEPVHCPPEAASALIEPALRALARGPMLAVRVPLPRSTGESDLALVHEVRFRIAHMRDESGLNDVVRITWGPESLIPMPDFTGTLTADWNADATGFVLDLEGEYDPPGGIVGEVFDAFVGSRIASATMHDLLCRTAGAVDELYQRAVTTGAPSSAEQRSADSSVGTGNPAARRGSAMSAEDDERDGEAAGGAGAHEVSV